MMAIHIGERESCIPINQPWIENSEIEAGTAQNRVNKYSLTIGSSCELQSISAIDRDVIGFFKIRSKVERMIDKVIERINRLVHSLQLFAPYAWAVSPLQPILKKAQFQYIKLNRVEPIDIAPMALSPPM